MEGPSIRNYVSDDLEAVYDICLRTGAAGGDASDLVENPMLFGDIWAGPYLRLEPEHCFVVDNGSGRAVGYVLGVLDAIAFEQRCEREWWPMLRERYPLDESNGRGESRGPDEGGGPGGTLDDLLIALIHNRSVPRTDLHAQYPSELHVDLLSEVQGRGWGALMIEHLFSSLKNAGSPGVHLGVSVDNDRAVGFYRHFGFTEVDCDGFTTTFVHRL